MDQADEVNGQGGRLGFGSVLLAMGLVLLAGACGGRTAEDASGGGGTTGLGGAGVMHGPTASGGTSLDAMPFDGTEGEDNGCNRFTVNCSGGGYGCDCPGVFAACPSDSVHCEPDADGEPQNCVCGEPDVTNDACTFLFQHRCGLLSGSSPWLATCTCDPALPTDDEPCRYYQQMHDDTGSDATCVYQALPGLEEQATCACR